MARPPKKDLQDRILRSAENKFFKYGFYKVSIEEIVADAGTSKAAVYRFYKSKEDLVEAVLNRLDDHINTNISVFTGNSALTFPEKLRKIIEFTSDLFLNINKTFLNDLVNYAPHLGMAYQRMRLKRINTYYKKLFLEGINTGIVRKDIPLDFILYYYANIMEIAVFPADKIEKKYSPRKVYQFLSALFYGGIKA